MRQGSFSIDMAKMVGEAEVIRLKERRKERRADRLHRFFAKVRRVFAFLLVSTVLVFAFCRREDLQDFIFSNLYKWSQASQRSDTFRQTALEHEKEVDDAAAK
jgi:hypothetical protein